LLPLTTGVRPGECGDKIVVLGAAVNGADAILAMNPSRGQGITKGSRRWITPYCNGLKDFNVTVIKR
jgi:hypothetical protein